MKEMKYMLILPFVNMAIAGCNSSIPVQNDTAQTTVHQTEQLKQKRISEAIVVFRKGMSIQEAREVIASYGMQVLKVYTTISESTQKPMLHIASSLPMEEMMQQLRKDPYITSISSNYKRHL